jgi:hypothetical protein
VKRGWGDYRPAVGPDIEPRSQLSGRVLDGKPGYLKR